MSKSIWTRLFLIGLIICCGAFCYAQDGNISHCSTFMQSIGDMRAFASSGQYSYVLHGYDGLYINTYDVSDIMNVNWESTTTLNTVDYTHYPALLVHEDRLIVLRNSGMVIYDISQPTSPVYVSALDIAGDFKGAGLCGDHLLTLYDHDLSAWDISSNAQPQIVDTLACPDSRSLYIIGTNAFIGLNLNQYSVVDVVDPTNLQTLGINQNPVTGKLSGVSGSNLVFLETYYSTADIHLYDSSMVLEPVLQGSISLSYISHFDSIISLLVQGTRLMATYLSGFSNSYHENCIICEVGDPTSPVIIYNREVRNGTTILADGVHRMILGEEYSFRFLDSTHSQLLGDPIFNSAIFQIAANDTNVFTYTHGCGVTSYNICDPFSPFKEDQVSIPDLQAIGLDGNLLVTSQGPISDTQGDWRYYLKLHQVSDSGTIQTINNLYTSSNYSTKEIRIVDSKQLLLSGGQGVQIYNLNSPADPTLALRIYDDNFYVSGILDGDYLYSAVRVFNRSIKIYDIVNYSPPALLSTIAIDFDINRIQKIGSFLFVGGDSQAIKIIDVTDPLVPIEYGEIPVSAYVKDILITNDALVVLHHNSLAVYKITNPLLPVLAGTYPVEGGARCLALSGNYALVGTNHHVSLYDCSAAFDICETTVQDQELVPSAFRLSCYPNPFREKVNIDFDLPKSGMLALDIYNVRGQKVKSLDPRYYIKGVNSVYWDVQNDLSSALPAGIYILKAQSGSHSASTRMVLLK